MTLQELFTSGKLVATSNRVIVQEYEPSKKTEGGLFIALNIEDRPAQGLVVAVGAGKAGKDGKVLPFTVTVGDKVMFTTGAGHQVTVEGHQMLVLTEDDIVAQLDEYID